MQKFCFTRLAILAALTLTTSLSGCGGTKTEANFPDKNREGMYKNGSLLSESGGVDLLGGETKSEQTGLAVNAYLWRAALDTVSFMPLASADPFGGTIITDWYSAPKAASERMKLNVLILDRELRADGVRVKAFKQILSGKQWVDAAVNPEVARTIEDTILTRARQLRLEQKAREN